MNKTLQILEKNVEWIAMGAGGLWLLWIVWAYILTPPSIDLVGQKLTPTTIDEYIQDNTRKNLDTRINDPKIPPGLKASDYKPNWVFQVPGPIAGISVGSDPPLKPLLDTKDFGTTNTALVKALPVIPAPTDLGMGMGRCQIVVPPPVVPPVADAAPGVAPRPAAAGLPVVARPAVGVGPAGVVEAQAADRNWVWVSALIDPAAIDKAFVDAGIPDFLRQRQTFVYVQLERAEVLPNGTPGKPVLVKELPINALPIDPRDEKQRDDLINWLEQQQNQVRVINPLFYQVVGGDVPVYPPPGTVPGATAAADTAVPVPGAPQNFVVDGKFDAAAALAAFKVLGPKEKEEFRSHLTTEQKGLLYRAEQDDKTNNPGTGQGPRPRPVPNPNPRPRDAVDPDVIREMFAQARPAPAPSRRPNAPEYRPPEYRPPAPAPVRPYVPPNALPAPVAPGVVPAGANADGKLPIWQYDENAEPGKTCVYRIRVVMVNPVYRSNQADPTLKDVFLVEGQWSAWSKPVSLPASLRWFFVQASVPPAPERATFKVIKWEKGKPNSQSFSVSPGDGVGGLDKTSGVDYSTGWTVVDVRQMGGGDNRVTLINERGETMIKRSRQDQKDFDIESTKAAPKASAMAN